MKKLKNIMLIDDNIHANYFNEIKLQQNNACDKITIFMNGKEALDYLVNNKETDVDLILLDINMPVMNGWQFLSNIERVWREIDKSIPIFILSSSVNTYDKQKSAEYESVKGFINKPLNDNDLKEMIDYVLQ
jgi:response regulator RpfG family c-di-GMP phosphodiesterase